MTPDEALAVLTAAHGVNHPLGGQDEALAVLASGLQHARVLAAVAEDRGVPSSGRRTAVRRFREWERGERA